jgi:hypothetical protein
MHSLNFMLMHHYSQELQEECGIVSHGSAQRSDCDMATRLCSCAHFFHGNFDADQQLLPSTQQKTKKPALCSFSDVLFCRRYMGLQSVGGLNLADLRGGDESDSDDSVDD